MVVPVPPMGRLLRWRVRRHLRAGRILAAQRLMLRHLRRELG